MYAISRPCTQPSIADVLHSLLLGPAVPKQLSRHSSVQHTYRQNYFRPHNLQESDVT
jgi:hypothetical protein